VIFLKNVIAVMGDHFRVKKPSYATECHEYVWDQ